MISAFERAEKRRAKSGNIIFATRKTRRLTVSSPSLATCKQRILPHHIATPLLVALLHDFGSHRRQNLRLLRRELPLVDEPLVPHARKLLELLRRGLPADWLAGHLPQLDLNEIKCCQILTKFCNCSKNLPNSGGLVLGRIGAGLRA